METMIICPHCRVTQVWILADCRHCSESLTEACEDEACACHERLPAPGDRPA